MSDSEPTGLVRWASYHADDEPANTATHMAGLALSLGGTGALVVASWPLDLAYVLACSVYAATLVLTYAVSSASHAVEHLETKLRLVHWDQGVIYLLIVGTYTPLLCSFVPRGLLVPVLSGIWIAALLGFYSKVVASHRVQEKFSVVSYLALGWIPALALLYYSPLECLGWIALGGVFYTAGTWIQDQRRYFHAIWHIFVILGSACHWYAIYSCVLLKHAAG